MSKKTRFGKMNKLCCLLTGGHRYSPSMVTTCRNELNFTIEMRNFCVKCNKIISFEIPDNFIDKEIERFKEKERKKDTEQETVRFMRKIGFVTEREGGK